MRGKFECRLKVIQYNIAVVRGRNGQKKSFSDICVCFCAIFFILGKRSTPGNILKGFFSLFSKLSSLLYVCIFFPFSRVFFRLQWV